MIPKPSTACAHKLMEDGLDAFADIEERGIEIDVSGCRNALKRVEDEVRDIKKKLLQTPEVQQWRRWKGPHFKLTSDQQLSDFLFKRLNYEPVAMTDSGARGKTDADSLEQLNIPWVSDIIKMRTLSRPAMMFVQGLLREQVGGRIHPSFALHIPTSYRSSCSSPNVQNNPVRTPWLAELIRSLVIARPGFAILEFDYGRLEVCGGACYHKDPVMLKYLEDDTSDMHMDMACELYVLRPEEVTKQVRFSAKSNFVFAEFYGSYWKQVAPALWRDITRHNLARRDGVGLMEHLRSEGLGAFRCPDCEAAEKDRFQRRGDRACCFENHVRLVEKRFWGQRFAVYDAWRRDHYREYQRRGFFDTLTGFRCSGVMSRNDAVNYPIQGSSFHINLWSIITMNRWAKKYGMRSGIINEIHDSIIWEVHPDEIEDVLEVSVEVMTRRVRKAWPWIITPLVVEAEMSPVDGSWLQKKKVKGLS